MAIEYVPYNLTLEQVADLWDGYGAGQTVAQLARRFGKKQASMYQRTQASGGIRPTIPRRAARHLGLEDREEISRGLATGHSLRQIADQLGRSPSTISLRGQGQRRGRATGRLQRTAPRPPAADGPSRASWPRPRGWRSWSRRSCRRSGPLSRSRIDSLQQGLAY